MFDLPQPRLCSLSHSPLGLFRTFAADTIDGNSVLWFSRATGAGGWFGLLHEPLGLLVQIVLQVLSYTLAHSPLTLVLSRLLTHYWVLLSVCRSWRASATRSYPAGLRRTRRRL